MPTRTSYLLGIDLGASSLKASVVTDAGRIAGQAQAPVTTRTPQPGWSEQDPEQWYQALCAAVPAALAQAGVNANRLAGIGISAGAHTPVLLDDADQPIRPAILWNDQRSAVEARELHEQAGELIIKHSLNKANATWTLAMLRWLQKHEPHNIARVNKLCLAKDYLRFRITGAWHTDFSDAVGALMADAKTRNWCAAICALIDWPLHTLPPIVQPTDIVGAVNARAAVATGLSAGTPVVCGSNDTTVELYGVGAVTPGQGAIKLATAGVLSLVTQGPLVNPPISCYPHIVDGMYYTATGTNACASAHRWLHDRFFLPLTDIAGAEAGVAFEQMDKLAASIPAGSDGLIFHPYLQGERAPYWDPWLRADFIGITLQHNRAHFARALYEGVAYSLCDLLASARSLGQEFGVIRLIGGGARSALWRQIVCDVIGLEMEKPACGEASFGSALVAGIGVGVFSSPLAAVARCVSISEHHQPDLDKHALYSQLFEIYREAQAKLAPLNHRLHALCIKSTGITA